MEAYRGNLKKEGLNGKFKYLCFVRMAYLIKTEKDTLCRVSWMLNSIKKTPNDVLI